MTDPSAPVEMRGGAPTAGTPAVELAAITKTFPGVVANDRIDLTVRRGEVLCLLGENGAGKSTLMSILSGMLRPDSGRVLVDGREMEIDSPRAAIELGIGMVYQHSTLVPTLSVLENLMLGAEGGLRLDVAGARRRLAELSGTLGVQIDPGAQAGSLALGQQQHVEIVKALWRGSRVLILDEPTSMLAPQGVVELGNVIGRLKQSGLAVVFITHKLHEALDLGDRVVILRQGRLAGSLGPEVVAGRSREELQGMIVGLMFGEESRAVEGVAELADRVEHEARRAPAGEPLLELIHVSATGDRGVGGIEDISLAVRPGEILGIAGVDGNGQRELAEAIAGQRPLAAGELRLGGRTISRLSVSRRERLGLRYVTDDRLGEGTVSGLSVALNLVLKRIGQTPFWRRGSIRKGEIDSVARTLVEEFDVRTPSTETRVAALSGGNVQKVVLARELSFAPRVVIFNKPTYGLDVRTTRAVRARVREQADAGVAAIVISTDLEELVDLCDRIAVLFRGRLAGVIANAPGAEQRIGELMVGGKAA
jgi:ABC-type uncharacterized transport system ATPase subunit